VHAGSQAGAVKHAIIKFLSGMSLLLCIATVALWVRSHQAADGASFARARTHDQTQFLTALRVQANQGSALAGLARYTFKEQALGPDGYSWGHETSDPEEFTDSSWQLFHGFGYWQSSVSRSDPSGRAWAVTFPLWLPALLFALFPTASAWQSVRKRRRSRLGFCRECGCDRRATRDRCPECGAADAPSPEVGPLNHL
jgi:hypothetical protein